MHVYMEHFLLRNTRNGRGKHGCELSFMRTITKNLVWGRRGKRETIVV